jgi:hypothetical protein
MSRFVVHGGIVRYRPGGITRVIAEALNQVTASQNSIVAVLGESDGGPPGAVSGIVSHSDPSRAAREYRSGILVDAIRNAFQSSNDPDVPSGASEVLIWKTNQSTQATGTLPSAPASFVIGSIAANDAEATGGSGTTLIDTTLTGSFADDALIGKILVIRPFTATGEAQVITDYVDATGVITVGSAWSVNPAATDDYWVLDAEVYAASRVTGGGATVTWTGAALVADEHIGRWLFIQNSSSAADTYLVQITDNTTGAFTVSPSLPTLGTGAIAQILPNAVDLVSRDYGAHTNSLNLDVDDGVVVSGSTIVETEFEDDTETSPEVGGVPFLKLLYKGGAAAISDTVAVATASTSLITLVTAGLTIDAHIGKQVYFADLNEYTTISDNTASTLTLDPPLSAVPAAGSVVQIRTVTAGVGRIAGSTGVATSLVTTLTGVSGDDLAITFTAGMTLRQLQTAIQANSNYVATIPNGINGDILVAADFDFGPDTTISILNSENITDDGFLQNNMAVVNYFETSSEFISASRSAGGTMDGMYAPMALSTPVYLSGGSRGISSNQDFQDGFDALLLVRANGVVPLIDQNLTNEGYGSTATFASVAAQLGAHVATARGASQDTAGERGGYIGVIGNKAAIVARANAFNDTDVQLVAQNPNVLDSTGSLQTYTPRMYAVMAASMRAGVAEVGEPLTHKYIRTNGATQDSSWEPTDTTDSKDLIKAGVLFSETIDGVGTRWVRDLTTHVQDDNLAYTEGSVRDIVRYIAYGLRKIIVDKFTGRKGTPFSAESAKDVAISWLEVQRGDNIIVDSTDLTTGATIKAYHNIKVTLSGDVLRLNVGFHPAPGINFVLQDLYVQIPSQSA